jgi:hypothetical protein
MRRLPTRLLATTTLAVLAGGALSACSVLDEKHFEDDAKVSQKVTSVRLDSGNGGVRVEGSASTSEVSVHRKVNYRGDKPGGTSFRVEGGVLVLAGCGNHCGVDYVVKVPAGLKVTGGTSNGGLTLNAVGAVDVHTSNGEIRVDRASGPLKLRTSNGGVHVEGAKGDGIDARTSNGTVSIGAATPQNIKVHTSSGGLTVTAPQAPYRISADTTNGTKKVELKNDPAGRYTLDLSTSNGDLTVRPTGG